MNLCMIVVVSVRGLEAIAELLKLKLIDLGQRGVPIKLDPAEHQSEVKEISSHLFINKVGIVLPIEEVFIEVLKVLFVSSPLVTALNNLFTRLQKVVHYELFHLRFILLSKLVLNGLREPSVLLFILLQSGQRRTVQKIIVTGNTVGDLKVIILNDK